MQAQTGCADGRNHSVAPRTAPYRTAAHEAVARAPTSTAAAMPMGHCPDTIDARLDVGLYSLRKARFSQDWGQSGTVRATAACRCRYFAQYAAAPGLESARRLMLMSEASICRLVVPRGGSIRARSPATRTASLPGGAERQPIRCVHSSGTFTMSPRRGDSEAVRVGCSRNWNAGDGTGRAKSWQERSDG